MKEFEGLAITTVDEALQGRIAGLDIVANSGNLGSGTSMRLRGVSSINGSSEPLIVVDGNVWETGNTDNFDFSSANDEKFAELLNVNPEDIESIAVLKDGHLGFAGCKWCHRNQDKARCPRQDESYLQPASYGYLPAGRHEAAQR